MCTIVRQGIFGIVAKQSPPLFPTLIFPSSTWKRLVRILFYMPCRLYWIVLCVIYGKKCAIKKVDWNMTRIECIRRLFPQLALKVQTESYCTFSSDLETLPKSISCLMNYRCFKWTHKVTSSTSECSLPRFTGPEPLVNWAGFGALFHSFSEYIINRVLPWSLRLCCPPPS